MIIQNKKRYIPLKRKFIISHGFALCWLLLSIFLSINWVIELAELVSLPLSIFIITGIAYIPGYINAFTAVSLLMDRQPKLKIADPREDVTVLIACYNEEKSIGTTLEYLFKQTYLGQIKIIVIDNNSSDNTAKAARNTGRYLGMNLRVIFEKKPGKHHALNAALKLVDTKYVITLDADTLLMAGSLQYLMARQLSSPPDVVATAGAVLARNGRVNFWTRIQEWDYFLGIASIKRLQGMYQGTLVAQGAYSVYRTDKLIEVGGYPDVIGEDIVITWELLKRGYLVYFEPFAIAFTDVPESLSHFQKQRSRWARGMIEALRRVKPWEQPHFFVKYAVSINLIMPYIDLIFTLVWIPGVVLALFGITWVAGPMTLLVLPVAMIQNYILYKYQQNVFKELNLRIRKNRVGFFIYVLFYQMITSPISVYGYIEEFFNLKRVWK